MGHVTCAGFCQGAVRTSHAQPPSLPLPWLSPTPQDRGGCCNPSSKTIPVSAQLGRDISDLYCSSFPFSQGERQHPHQVPTSGRHQGTELPCCIHPKAEHHLPFKISLQKGKKKSWQGAWGWLCPRAAAVSCGSHASHTFKGTPTQLMDVSQPTVCVLTQPLCQGKTTVSVCGCVYIQRL